MFKRPIPHKKINPSTTPCVLPARGVVYDIVNTPDAPHPVIDHQFYYQNVDLYLKLLRRNYDQANLPFKRPQVSEPVKLNFKSRNVWQYTGHPDRVVLTINILKSGVVRVKLLTSMASLWEKYYSKSKTPPVKTVISTYKSMGYSDAFITNLQSRFEKKKALMARTQTLIEKIFEKAPKKKVGTTSKKGKKKTDDPPEEELGEPPEEDVINEDEDNPEEDEGITDDVEDDVEEDVVEEDVVDDAD